MLSNEISDEKSDAIFILIPLQTRYFVFVLFSLSSFNIIHLSSVLCSLNMLYLHIDSLVFNMLGVL